MGTVTIPVKTARRRQVVLTELTDDEQLPRGSGGWVLTLAGLLLAAADGRPADATLVVIEGRLWLASDADREDTP